MSQVDKLPCRVTGRDLLTYLTTKPPDWGIVDFRESANKPIRGIHYRRLPDGRYELFYIIFYLDYANQRVHYRTFNYIANLESLINDLIVDPELLALSVSRLDLTTAKLILSRNNIKKELVQQFVQHRFLIVTRLRSSLYTMLAQYVYLFINDMTINEAEAPRSAIIRRYPFTDLQYLRPIRQTRDKLQEEIRKRL
jgi:hypothetical protein